MDGAGMGRGGSKKCKSIPAPPRGAGLKSLPIPAPPPLRGGENPHGAKRGGTGQAGRGKIAIPSSKHIFWLVWNFSKFKFIDLKLKILSLRDVPK